MRETGSGGGGEGDECIEIASDVTLSPGERQGDLRLATLRLCFGMLDCLEIVRDPEILGGAPVFRGTRVPVESLFQHLEGGDSIEQFLEGFPSVTREQILAVLTACREEVVEAA